MHWGCELCILVKRAIACARAVRTAVPDARIYVNVVWAGNEVMGDNGFVPTKRYPFADPQGDQLKIISDIK